MHRKLIVGFLTIALIALPLNTRISSAGGGGGCSGEDEGECLAVVFGTAAVIIIITVLVAHYANKGPNAQKEQSLGSKTVSSDPQVTPSAEKVIADDYCGLKDWLGTNGETVVFRW